MNSTPQRGAHPEAESLNAFVEQALPAAAREQILAHLALCSRCREVVFLAQDAASVEDGTQTIANLQESRRRGWFAGWRWMWIPATALAGLVGFAVLHHVRNVPSGMAQVARNAPQEQVANSRARDKEEPAAKPASPGSFETKAGGAPTTRQKGVAGTADRELSSASERRSGSGDKAGAVQKQAAPAGEMASVSVMSSGPVNEKSYPIAGNLAQRPRAYGGPFAVDQALQQQAAGQQHESAKDQLHGARYTANAAAGAAGAVGQLEAQSRKGPMGPASAAAPSLTLKAAKNNVASSTDEIALDNKKKVGVLPNGRTALSVATAQGRTVAIDPSGTMFLSEAAGEAWIPITAQWKGRAVLLRTRRPLRQDGIASQSMIFELVTDRIETWVSSDGKTWVPEALPQK